MIQTSRFTVRLYSVLYENMRTDRKHAEIICADLHDEIYRRDTTRGSVSGGRGRQTVVLSD